MPRHPSPRPQIRARRVELLDHRGADRLVVHDRRAVNVQRGHACDLGLDLPGARRVDELGGHAVGLGVRRELAQPRELVGRGGDDELAADRRRDAGFAGVGEH
jgi:hypothetical protein